MSPAIHDNHANKLGTYHPRPQRLAHVVLRTTPDRFNDMVNFYVQTLNASIRQETPGRLAFLSFDEEHHRIAVVAVPDLSPATADGPPRTGLDHIAFTFQTLTELAQVYVSLRDRQENPLKPVWVVNHGPTTSLYYRDPDRNKIEMQVDNFDSNEEANAFMNSPEFAENPFGVDFDPEEWSQNVLNKARDDGSEGLSTEEIKKLKQRPNIGPRPTVPLDIL